ncbi:Uracil-DNA glycosylase [Marinilactibacillus piezotolerans]|uniref:Uracil-DNA glycosylase n=1 Tax=Marinilactibacillus piezotolerans TaxID=258723 RepID=A0A1I3YTJ9_9LACT|nr:uracil-DNA glycosylase [Marinilactibacillus piezotolerans]SFK35217.1 Uracil-DNA glycosylase [Marinilactibacillus piezotolerans]
MPIPVENDWKPILKKIEETESYKQLREFLVEEYNTETIYPKKENIWQAFEWTPYNEVKAVILGQDPYHGANQAHGLAFSVRPEVKLPPSLKNIYKELQDDLGVAPVKHGYLKSWAQQGVLMLNTILTVRAGEAHSHKNKGWELLTDEVIRALNEREKPVVFILWGTPAQKKRGMIDETKHKVITSVHPSPLAAYRGFFGSKPFSKTNEFLRQSNQEPIDWKLPVDPMKE